MALTGLLHRKLNSLLDAEQNFEWLRNQPVTTTDSFAAATTPGTVVGKIEVFDAQGNSLGFLPVYNAIT